MVSFGRSRGLATSCRSCATLMQETVPVTRTVGNIAVRGAEVGWARTQRDMAYLLGARMRGSAIPLLPVIKPFAMLGTQISRSPINNAKINTPMAAVMS